jgi:hypothetical protein
LHPKGYTPTKRRRPLKKLLKLRRAVIPNLSTQLQGLQDSLIMWADLMAHEIHQIRAYNNPQQRSQVMMLPQLMKRTKSTMSDLKIKDHTHLRRARRAYM